MSFTPLCQNRSYYAARIDSACIIRPSPEYVNSGSLPKIGGQQIPAGWAVDAEGNPTQDPTEAEKGSLLPVGGPKGYGMALMLDIQAGILSQGRFGAHLLPPPRPRWRTRVYRGRARE